MSNVNGFAGEDAKLNGNQLTVKCVITNICCFYLELIALIWNILNGEKCIHSEQEQTWNKQYDNYFDKASFIFFNEYKNKEA